MLGYNLSKRDAVATDYKFQQPTVDGDVIAAYHKGITVIDTPQMRSQAPETDRSFCNCTSSSSQP
jgi:hypothetical protein